MQLTGTSDVVKLTTGSAGTIHVRADWVDLNGTSVTPGRTNTAAITSATTTDIVGSPASSQQRRVKDILIFNTDASVSNLLTIKHTDGTNQLDMFEVTLAASEALSYSDMYGWRVYDSAGAVKTTLPAAIQADMEAASSTSLSVTPGRQHYHPSAAKFWVEFTGNSTTILASYNMTSITDGTTEATVTINTDFSSASWSPQATATGSATTAAAYRGASARSIAAGSVIVFCVDGAATPALQDPSQWSVVGFGDH